MPGSHQRDARPGVQGLEPVLGDDLLQHLRVQDVQRLERALAVQHAAQRRVVPRPPRVGDGRPVGLQPRRRAGPGERPRDARPPVDQRAEHVKGDDLDVHARTVAERPAAMAAKKCRAAGNLPASPASR